MPEKENIIQQKTFAFARQIIALYLALKNEKEFVISRQLLRSGTSIGANVEEAIAAFSKKDFTHKMNIAQKEARESKYWLRLLSETHIAKSNTKELLTEVEEIIRILTAIVKSSQSNINNS